MIAPPPRRSVGPRLAHAVVALVAAGALAATLGACGDDPSSTGPVTVKLTDHRVDPSRDRATAGPVTFDIANDTVATTHELLVLRTDLDPADLPLDEEGAVDEKGPGVTFVDEREDIDPGDRVGLTVDLQAGRYLLLCNLDDHYARGMYRTFEVTG